MQFKPILDKIESIIKASDANAKIRLYRTYLIEPGAMATPICLIGSSRSLKLNEAYLGVSGGANPRLWDFEIGISILSRRYPLPAQVKRAAEEIDEAQAAVYAALNADMTLDDSVTQAWVENVREITLLNGEYFGYQIMLVGQKHESAV